jgi:hypothetical protein
LRGVAPGDYVFVVQPIFGRDAAAGDGASRSEGFSVAVSVGSVDIADLNVVVPLPATVSGRLVFDGVEHGAGGKHGLSLSGTQGLFGSLSARIGADGRFVLQVTPGPRTVEVWGGRGWMLKQLTWKGREIDSGDDIDIETDGGRLEAVFTDQVTAIIGTVNDSGGRKVSDYQVVVFPEDAALRRRGRVRFERPDQKGHFRAEGLRPGRYLVLASSELEVEDALEPEVFDALRRVATPVRLGPGETQAVTLTLVYPP